MPKKKTQFPKRDRRNKMAAIIAGACTLAVAAVIVVAVSVWNHNRSWILEFEGERIPIEEFEFFARFHKGFIEQQVQSIHIWEGSEDDHSRFAKELALSELENVLAVLKFADYHGVTLNDEMRASAREEADTFINMYRDARGRIPGIDVERITDFFAHPFMVEALVEQLGYRAEVSRADFEAEHAVFLEENVFEYRDILISYYFALEYQEAADFLLELEQGGDFHELLEQAILAREAAEQDLDFDFDFDFDFDENQNGENDENGEEEEQDERVLLMDFHHGFFGFSDDDLRAIAALEVGEFSGPMTNEWDEWVIVFIEEITEPDLDDLKQERWEEFELRSRQEHVLTDMFVPFAEELDINLNQRAFDAVRVINL